MPYIFDHGFATGFTPTTTGARVKAYHLHVTPEGIVQWKVNIMGLTNAAQQFQRMMEEVLESVKDCADAYIYEIIVETRAEKGEY